MAVGNSSKRALYLWVLAAAGVAAVMPFIIPVACGSTAAEPTQPAEAGVDAALEALPDRRQDSADSMAEKDSIHEEGDVAPTGWWNDPEIWTPVPNGELCDLHVADVEKAGVGGWTWSPCGPGCLETPAPLELPVKMGLTQTGTSAGVVDGQLLLKLLMGNADVGLIQIIVNVSENTPLVLARSVGPDQDCIVPGHPVQAPTVVSFMSFSSEPAIRTSTLDSSTGVLDWHDYWISTPVTPVALFGWSRGWGMTFYDATVRVVTDPAATEMTTIAQALLATNDAVGRGAGVVF